MLTTETLPIHDTRKQVIESGGVVDANRRMDKHVRRYATGFLHQTAIVSKRAFIAVLRNPATSIFQVRPSWSELPPCMQAGRQAGTRMTVWTQTRPRPFSTSACIRAHSLATPSPSHHIAHQVLTFIVSGVLLGAFFYGKLGDGPNALQAHMGCMFMVAYMIIFSAITSLELFIQVRARTCTCTYPLSPAARGEFTSHSPPICPYQNDRSGPSSCTRRPAASTAPRPTSSPRSVPHVY